MAEVIKEVLINGEKLMYGTNVKGTRNTNANSTPTFDGVIPSGTSKVSHSIEISRLSYDGYTTYTRLCKIIDDMLEIGGMVTVREKHIMPNEEFDVIYDYHDCIVDGDDYEIKPEERTVENLKFLCGSRTRTINKIK